MINPEHLKALKQEFAPPAPIISCHTFNPIPPNSPVSVRDYGGGGRSLWSIAAQDRRPEVFLHLMFQAWKARQGNVADSIYSNVTREMIKRMDFHIWEQAVANYLFRSGQFAQASLHYRRAINDKPDCDLCWFNLGNCHLELNGLFEAIDCYREALALWEEFNPALLNLGIAYLRLSMEEDVKNRSSATSRMCAARAVKAFQSVKLPTLKLSAQINEFETTVRYHLKRRRTGKELEEVVELYSYLSNHVGFDRMEWTFDLTEYWRELDSDTFGRFRRRRPELVTPRHH